MISTPEIDASDSSTCTHSWRGASSCTIEVAKTIAKPIPASTARVPAGGQSTANARPATPMLARAAAAVRRARVSPLGILCSASTFCVMSAAQRKS